MITKITIKNFQAHKKLEIDVDPELTTIVGSSDVGKSAIVRAIRLVMMNRPTGFSFVKYGADDTRVRMVIDDRVLVRERGKKTNQYVIDKKVLKAFNSEVPEEVAKLAGVADINFQQQHDAPFWFSDTAGEVSRKLNGIINLGAIDAVLGAVASRQRQAATAVAVAEEGLTTARKARKALVWVEDADRALGALEAKAETRRRTAVNAARLHDLVQDAVQRQDDQTDALNRLRYGRAVLEKVEERQQVREKSLRLGELIGDAKRAAVWASQRMPEADVIVARIEKLVEVRAAWKRLATVVWDARASKDGRAAELEALEKYEGLFKVRMGKRCPLCLQKMKSSQ